MSLLHFCALTVVVPLLSMEGQRALGFHQKYLNLCSKDERRSYGFGTTWGWVINVRIFIIGWTIPKYLYYINIFALYIKPIYIKIDISKYTVYCIEREINYFIIIYLFIYTSMSVWWCSRALEINSVKWSELQQKPVNLNAATNRTG